MSAWVCVWVGWQNKPKPLTLLGSERMSPPQCRRSQRPQESGNRAHAGGHACSRARASPREGPQVLANQNFHTGVPYSRLGPIQLCFGSHPLGWDSGSHHGFVNLGPIRSDAWDSVVTPRVDVTTRSDVWMSPRVVT